jgi:ribosomal protein L11 methylase PrmA
MGVITADMILCWCVALKMHPDLHKTHVAIVAANICAHVITSLYTSRCNALIAAGMDNSQYML